MDPQVVIFSIKSGLRNLFGSWLSPGQTWQDLLQSPNHQLAAHYFLLNAGLVVLALVWGIAIIGVLFRVTVQQNIAAASRVSLLALVFLAIFAGFTIITTELFLLALAHWLVPTAISVLGIATTALAAATIFFTRYSLANAVNWRLTNYYSALASIFVIVLLLIFQFASVFTPTWGDGSSFHLPYADFFLQHQGLAVHEHLIYPYHVFNANLLYSLALWLQHDYSYAQSVHALFVALTMFGIYVFCRETSQRIWLAIFLTFLYTLLFHSIWARRLANVDAQGTAFIFASVFAFWMWQKYRLIPLGILSASFLGMALGTKYVLLAFIVPAAIGLFWIDISWRQRFLYAGVVMLLGGWWYVRNLWLMGNPVHPFAPSIFGYDLWDAADMQWQLGSGLKAIPKTVAGIAQMPVYAWKNEILYAQGAFIILLMLYVSTALCWLLRERLNLLLLFAWVYVFSWIASSQDPRHLMPVFPLVFVHFGALANQLFNRMLPLLPKTGGMVLLVALMVTAVGFAMERVRWDFGNMLYTPLVAGAEQNMFLSKNPRLAYFLAANTAFTETETFYEFAARDGRWFFKSHVVGNQFGPHGYNRVYVHVLNEERNRISPERLEKFLSETYGASGFLIPPPVGFLYSPEEFDLYFDLKFRNAEGSIYRFRR